MSAISGHALERSVVCYCTVSDIGGSVFVYSVLITMRVAHTFVDTRCEIT